MNYASGHLCFLTAILASWYARQSLLDSGRWGWLSRLPSVVVASVMFFKGWERIEGDLPSTLDLIRDIAIALMFFAMIATHWRRYGHL